MKKIMQILLSTLVIILLSQVLPIQIYAATRTEIQNKMIAVLYNGNGGKLSCDFDGYVNTSGRHEGIDFCASGGKGSSIYSLIDGEVTRCSNSSSLSTLAIYDATNNKTVVYLHGYYSVSVGQKISKGQYVGYESNLGATAAHTHIEVRDGRKTSAAVSVGDSTLDNSNPYSYWEKVMCSNNAYNPHGCLDSVTGGYGTITLRGWAFDQDNYNANLAIHVYVGGQGCGSLTANVFRDDVNAVYQCGNYHGFDGTVAVDRSITGKQTVHVYAINVGEGTNSLIGTKEVTILDDTESPVISNIKVSDITSTGYTVSCTVTDNNQVDRVQFPTWTEPSQDDIQYHWAESSKASGTKSGNTYTYRVNISDHNNEGGPYMTHIWAFDTYGNSVSKAISQEVYVQYTVSYNANGGTGAPSSQTKVYGTTLTLSSTKPTRTGYTFFGWSTSSSATSATYQAGGSYTANSGATLYAVWKANPYTVSYNANGGSGAPSSQTKTYGTTLTLSSTKPTRTGYTFLGWATSSNATSATYQAGGSYTTNSSVTLYAVWRADTYTVSYNANGGTGAPSSQTKTYGVTLTLSSTKPTRTGYTFLGWSTSSSATSATYQAGGSYTTNSSVTLYAVWKADTYTVSYNGNGGTGAPSSQTKTYGIALTLSSTKPTRTGYTFLGWATSSSATSATYQAGGSYTANSGATLYAVWKADTYTVSYNANGGTGVPSSQVKTHDVTLSLSTVKPVRDGYTFLGWSTDKNTINAQYQPGEGFTRNESVTLYAVWTEEEAKTYIVTYDANGGTGEPAAQIKVHDTELILSSIKPIRTGYTFLGWSTSSSATSATYQAGGSYTANSAVTLYAVWKADTYTVSYDANGGTGAPSSQTKTYDVILTLSNVRPVRDGYNFLGWSTDKNAVNAQYQPGEGFTGNENVTLYAVWQKERVITEIIKQPSNQTVKEGTTALFIIEANGENLRYEWYYKEPFGNEWKMIEGENSANLRVFADSSKDGYSYYCRITDAAEEQIISNTVMLNVVTDAFVNPFKDIQKTDWYCNSVMWAAENKVVAGLTQDLFGPSVACSRAQIVTFLWRAEGKPKAQSRECPFEDVDRSQYYYEAMLWAVEEGIAKGYTETKFAPDVTCARAEIVTFLWRLKNKPETGTQQNPFTDVKNSDYYYKAMLWAVENKIANGYTEDTFAPYNTITRAETVALLYRLYR